MAAGRRETLGALSDIAASLPATSETVEIESGEPWRWVDALAALARRSGADILLLPHDDDGRDLAPRLAARLNASAATDCLALAAEGAALRARRPVLGGALIEEVGLGLPAVVTLRVGTTAVSRAPSPALGATWSGQTSPIRIIQTHRPPGGPRPSLRDARIVVAGGRGLGGPENWHWIESTANALGAAVGASGAVVDAGWVPAHLRIGLTGARVTPAVYVAIGISGSPQHMAGCEGAGAIVAINVDPSAPIVARARLAAIADYREVLPGLIDGLRETTG